MPAAVASTVGYSVFCFSLPPEYRFMPLFGDQLQFDFVTTLELVPYAFLALVLVLAGVIYIHTFYWVHGLFDRLNVPTYLKSTLGALAAGVVGVEVFKAVGDVLVDGRPLGWCDFG